MKLIKTEEYQKILDNKQIIWVLIASKNYLHCKHGIMALENGKHVFCEKPLAISIEECEKLRDAAYKYKKMFITGFVLRYSPIYEKVKEIIKSGELGKIISLEANEHLAPDHGGYIFRNWRRFKEQAGAHIVEKCCHDIDIINWILDSVPKKVSAFGGTDIFTKENMPVAEKLEETDKKYCEEKNTNLPPLFTSWHSIETVHPFQSEKSIEDNIVAIMEYRNGAKVSFHANACTSMKQRRLYICGLEGTLEAELHERKITVRRINRSAEKKVFTYEFAKGMHAGGDQKIVNEWGKWIIKTIEQEKKEWDLTEVKGSVDECFISTVSCLCIDLARETDQIVKMDDIWKKFGF